MAPRASSAADRARPSSHAPSRSDAEREAALREARPGFPRPVLCAVLDAKALGAAPRTRAAALFAAGVDWIQLRDRALEDEALYSLARALVAARADAGERSQGAGVALAADARPRVLVNKRIDIALAASADGVHLGFDALAEADARALLGRHALIGASLHSLAEVEAAARSGLDYAHLAPIWNPRSKPASRPALGPAVLARASRAGLALLAQGGLDPQRASEARAAGAAGIAVTGILGEATEPTEIARRLRVALGAEGQGPR